MRRVGLVLLWVCGLLLGCSVLPAGAAADETVMVCDIYGNHVGASAVGTGGIDTSIRCPGNVEPGSYSRAHPPGGMAVWTVPGRAAHTGASAHWRVAAPAGLLIDAVYIPHMYSHGINDGGGWAGGLYWHGGGVRTTDGERGWSSTSQMSTPFKWPSRGTSYFGWQLACRSRTCGSGGTQWLSVELLKLRVRETAPPRLSAPDGLWAARGWIRGEWRLRFSGDSPSGVCRLTAELNHEAVAESLSQQDHARWHECAAPPVQEAVNTTLYGNGPLPLTLQAVDAASTGAKLDKQVNVDNESPTISLSGPTSAPSTSGTQYIHAKAVAGPSGVAGISCSVDGAGSHWYPAATAAVPVRGVGTHQVKCFSENRARNAAGKPATSVPATWTLTIRVPSRVTIAFVREKNALRCTHHRERVRVPAHWITAYHGGHRVRLHVPAQTRHIKVVHCHRAHHGRTARAATDRLHVPFGTRTLVAGRLTTSAGRPLRGQSIRILAAAADGSSSLRQVAVARTGQDGTWTAQLPAGPSSTVVAQYAGAPTIEPATSAPAHLVVTAALRLHIHPTSAHWGGTIKISGRVRGGYIPPAGELVVLKVGWAGGSAVIGNLYTHRDGQFSTTYTFHNGTGTQTYSIWATTARETPYPYAPGRSNRVRVTVGP